MQPEVVTSLKDARRMHGMCVDAARQKTLVHDRGDALMQHQPDAYTKHVPIRVPIRRRL
jgi:hypothetical protein